MFGLDFYFEPGLEEVSNLVTQSVQGQGQGEKMFGEYGQFQRTRLVNIASFKERLVNMGNFGERDW